MNISAWANEAYTSLNTLLKKAVVCQKETFIVESFPFQTFMPANAVVNDKGREVSSVM